MRSNPVSLRLPGASPAASVGRRAQGPRSFDSGACQRDLGCWGGGEVFTSGPLEESRPVSEGCGVGLAKATLA